MTSPTPLPLSIIQTYLQRVTYRPGWTIVAYSDPWEGVIIRIVGSVENSYDPGHFIDLGVVSYLPPVQTVDELSQWLAWRLGRIENHEMREWLKCDGKPIYDPHAEDGAE